MLHGAASGKNVVCKSEVEEVRVGVVFGNSDSVFHFPCFWSSDVL